MRIYAIRNEVYYVHPQGYVEAFLTRKERNEAIAKLRETAVNKGLDGHSARHGIRAVSFKVDFDLNVRLIDAIEADPGLLIDPEDLR